MSQSMRISILLATVILTIAPVTRSQSEFFGRGQKGSCIFGIVERSSESTAFGFLFGESIRGCFDFNIQVAFDNSSSSDEDGSSSAFGVSLGATTGARANEAKQTVALSADFGGTAMKTKIFGQVGVELLLRPSLSHRVQLLPNVSAGVIIPTEHGLKRAVVLGAGIAIYIPTNERSRLVVTPAVRGVDELISVGLSVGIVTITQRGSSRK